MRMSAPCAFASSSVPDPPGTRIMSPKQVKITLGLHRATAIASSTRPMGITQTGQPGPVYELDVRGQQVVDAVLVDRVRVPAAHLHDLVVAAGLDRRHDLARERTPELGVAVLVDELHVSLARRDARMYEHRVAHSDGTDEIEHDLALRPVTGRAQRDAVLRGLDDPHRDTLVRAGDAVVVGATAHSITLALSSSSSAS